MYNNNSKCVYNDNNSIYIIIFYRMVLKSTKKRFPLFKQVPIFLKGEEFTKERFQNYIGYKNKNIGS